jgi:cytochrome P450
VTTQIATSHDPFPEYARMRERGRVHRIAEHRPWMITGHAEVEAVLKDPRTFSSAIGGGPMGIGTSMLMMDPPEHTRLRNIVSRAFTPRSISELAPRIREITIELLDRVEVGTPFDLVEAVSIPLPITVIAEMLGIDPAHRADFKRWSSAITGVVPMNAWQLREEFARYFEGVFDERRREPRNDLISRLLAPTDEEALSMDELLSFVMLLLVAGNETTTNLIGLAALYLGHHDDQRDALAADPRLILNAVEEILRFDGPVHMVPPRIVTRDVTIAGFDLPTASWVMPVLAAANRDPLRFDDPNTFDVTRPDASSHVAFGSGVHFCLGAPLARLEGRIALEELLARGLCLAEPDEVVRFADSSILRSVEALPVVLTCP